MKTPINKIINNFSKVLLVSICISVIILSSEIRSSNAIGCPQCSTFFTQIFQFVEDRINTAATIGTSISSYTTALNQYDEIVKRIEDSFIFPIIKNLAANFTIAAGNWIKSGFKGEPAFLTDPLGFAQYIVANQINTEIAGVANSIANRVGNSTALLGAVVNNSLNTYSNDVINQLVGKDLEVYKVVQESMCDESNLKLIEKYDSDKIDRVRVYCGIDILDMNDAERNAMVDLYLSLKAPIDRFAYNNLIFRGVTRVNIGIGLASVVDKKLAEAQGALNNELLQGGGFLGSRGQCLEEDEVGNCKRYAITTPGGVLAELAKFTQLTPQRTLESVDTFKKLGGWSLAYLANSGKELLQGAVIKGIRSIQTSLTATVSKVVSQQNKGIRDSLKSFSKDLEIKTGNYTVDKYGNIVEPEPKTITTTSSVPGIGITATGDIYKQLKISEYNKVYKKGDVTTDVGVFYNGVTTIVQATPEIIENIRNYKTNRSQVFSKQLENLVKNYADLYKIYNKVRQKYLVSKQESDKLYELYNSIKKPSPPTRDILKLKQELKQRVDEISQGKDIDLYEWRLKYLLKYFGEINKDYTCPAKISLIQYLKEVKACFDKADSISEIDDVAKLLDVYKDKLNYKEASSNKSASFDIINTEDEYDKSINLEKDIGEDAAWSSLYESLYSIKNIESSSFSAAIESEKSKDPSRKNKVYYVTLQEEKLSRLPSLKSELECLVGNNVDQPVKGYSYPFSYYYWENGKCELFDPTPSLSTGY